MFEAIHGSAPRMVEEGRDKYADPCSMLRATVMLLSHIGKQEKADLLSRALDICMFEERSLKSPAATPAVPAANSAIMLWKQ